MIEKSETKCEKMRENKRMRRMRERAYMIVIYRIVCELCKDGRLVCEREGKA